MQKVFADTGYWIAMLNPEDDLHEKAVDVSKTIYPVKTVTSELVLTELLNAFSKRGSKLRGAAVNLIAQLKADPNTEIIKQNTEQFEAALGLYNNRLDKDWSHTDCASFLLMETEGIRDALAYDKHFEQARYRALLR